MSNTTDKQTQDVSVPVEVQTVQGSASPSTRATSDKPIQIGDRFFSKRDIISMGRDISRVAEYAKRFGYGNKDIDDLSTYVNELARGIAEGVYTVQDDYKTIKSENGFGFNSPDLDKKRYRQIKGEDLDGDTVDSRKEAKKWKKEKELKNLAMNYIMQYGLAQGNTPTYKPGKNIYHALANDYLKALYEGDAWIGSDEYDPQTKSRATTNRAKNLVSYLESMKSALEEGTYDSSDFSYDNELSDWEGSKRGVIRELDAAIASLKDGSYDPGDQLNLWNKFGIEKWGELMSTSPTLEGDFTAQEKHNQEVEEEEAKQKAEQEATEKEQKELEEQQENLEKTLRTASDFNPFNPVYEIFGQKGTIPALLSNTDFTPEERNSLIEQIKALYKSDGVYTNTSGADFIYKMDGKPLHPEYWNGHVLRDLTGVLALKPDSIGQIISDTDTNGVTRYFAISKKDGTMRPLDFSLDGNKIIIPHSGGNYTIAINPIVDPTVFNPLTLYKYPEDRNGFAVLKDLLKNDYNILQIRDALDRLSNTPGLSQYVIPTTDEKGNKTSITITHPEDKSRKTYQIVPTGQLGLKIKQTESEQPKATKESTKTPGRVHWSLDSEENLKEQWNKEEFFTGSDKARFASAMTDLTSAVAGFVPGLHLASAVTGAASSLGEFGADIADIANQREGAQGLFSSLGELGLNLGMDLVSLIPAGKSVKAMKSLKSVAKYVPKIAMAIQAGAIALDDTTRNEFMSTLNKVSSLDLSKLNTQDLRNLTFLTRAVLGGVNTYKSRGSKPQKTNEYEVSGRVKTENGWEPITARVSKEEFSTFSKNKDAARKALVVEANKKYAKPKEGTKAKEDAKPKEGAESKEEVKVEPKKFTEEDIEVTTNWLGKAKTTSIKTDGSAYEYTPRHIFNTKKGVWFDDANLAKNYNFASKILTGKPITKEDSETKPNNKTKEEVEVKPTKEEELIDNVVDFTKTLNYVQKNNTPDVLMLPAASSPRLLPAPTKRQIKERQLGQTLPSEFKRPMRMPAGEDSSKEPIILGWPGYKKWKQKSDRMKAMNVEARKQYLEKSSKKKLLKDIDDLIQRKIDYFDRGVGYRKNLSEIEKTKRTEELKKFSKELSNRKKKPNKKRLAEIYNEIFSWKKGGKVLKGQGGLKSSFLTDPWQIQLQEYLSVPEDTKDFAEMSSPSTLTGTSSPGSNSSQQTGVENGNNQGSEQKTEALRALTAQNRKNFWKKFANNNSLLEWGELATSLIGNARVKGELDKITAPKTVPVKLPDQKVLGDRNALDTARQNAKQYLNITSDNLTSDSRLNTATLLEAFDKSRQLINQGEQKYRHLFDTTTTKSQEIASKNEMARIAEANKNATAASQIEAAKIQREAQNISNTFANFKNLFTQKRTAENQADAYLREYEMKKIDNTLSKEYDDGLSKIKNAYLTKYSNLLGAEDSSKTLDEKLNIILTKSSEAKTKFDSEVSDLENGLFDRKGSQVRKLFTNGMFKSGGKVSDKTKKEIAYLNESSKTIRKQLDHQHKERLLASKQIQKLIEKALS